MLVTSYYRSTNCTVLENSMLFFFPHLKQGFDVFVFYKELGVFIDFTVQNLQAKPDFSKECEVNVSLIAVIKS